MPNKVITIEDDEFSTEIEESEDQLFSRLYDTVISLGGRASVISVVTDDNDEKVVIMLSDVKYNPEVGFENVKK